jgi:hypothetical protein
MTNAASRTFGATNFSENVGLCFAHTLLGAFAEFWRATVSFVVYVRPSVRMEQLGSRWTDFHEIWRLSIFLKCAEKIQALLKTEKNKGYFT